MALPRMQLRSASLPLLNTTAMLTCSFLLSMATTPLPSMLVSLVGAIVLLGIVNMFRREAV